MFIWEKMKIIINEVVTVEEFVEGEFVKYIINTAVVCRKSTTASSLKAQSLVHFSYEKSGGKIMLVDLQGPWLSSI
jgi:hypothetical protein